MAPCDVTFRRQVELHQEHVFRQSKAIQPQRVALGGGGLGLMDIVKEELSSAEEYNMVGPGVREKITRTGNSLMKQAREFAADKTELFRQFLAVNRDERSEKICKAMESWTTPGGGGGGGGAASRSVHVRAVKVTAFLEEQSCYMDVPVFHVRADDGLGSPGGPRGMSSYFVDGDARVYKDWDDYLACNKIPGCHMCYPMGGEYARDSHGDLALEYGMSPACTTYGRLVDAGDFVAAVGGLGCAVFAAAVLVPALAPVVLPAAGCVYAAGAVLDLWTVYRSVSALYDKKKHGESIGLKTCWAEWFGLLTAGVGLLGPVRRGASAVSQRLRGFKSWLQNQRHFQAARAWVGNTWCAQLATTAARSAYTWLAESRLVTAAASYVHGTYRYVMDSVTSVASYVQSTRVYQSVQAMVCPPPPAPGSPPKPDNVFLEAGKAVGKVVKKAWNVFWSWAKIGTTISSNSK